jgi:hypothetical protein
MIGTGASGYPFPDALPFVEDQTSACTDPRKRRRTGRNQDLLQCDETGMKPFSGFHEVMAKPLTINWTVGNDGPRGAA